MGCTIDGVEIPIAVEAEGAEAIAAYLDAHRTRPALAAPTDTPTTEEE